MAFKPISRSALLASESRCTFKPIFPSLSLVSRRTIIGPLGPPTSSPRTQPQSPSSSPNSQSQTSPPPARRPGPPGTLESFQRSPSTPSRQDLVTQATQLYNSSRALSKAESIANSRVDIDRLALNAAIEKQNTRRWRAGDVYAPHDLSSVEMMKWKQKRMVTQDAFEALDLDPRTEYKNYSMMWEYVTRMGRIKHSRDTGLNNVNQRRLAKAVRRSVGMGLMPSVHKHPEMLEAEAISHANFMARPQGNNVPKSYR